MRSRCGAVLFVGAMLLWSAAAPPRARTVVVDPANGAHAGADAVVATLADAAAWVAAQSVACPTDVLLTPGRHEVRRGAAFVGARGVTIRASSGRAQLVGGAFVAQPDWRPCDASARERLPAAAREHVRTLALRAEQLAGFVGGLAGPVHSGHSIAVQPWRSELFVGGEALVPARWPNDGYANIARLVDAGSVPRDAQDDIPLAKRRSEPPRGGVFGIDDTARLQRWAGATGAWAQGFWNWDWACEQLPIAKIDAAAGTVTLAQPHVYGLAARGRFFVTDLLEELDAPGEYWIDRERALVHAWLPAGAEAREVAVSLLAEPLLAFDRCTDVAVSGLDFACTRGDALVAHAIAGLQLDDCTFAAIGTRAVGIEGERALVTRCTLAGIGGIGIELSGGDRITLTPSGSAIEDCVLRGCGRVLRASNPAISLHGVGHRVAHCELAEHPHIALWFDGNDHVIEHNDIHDVVQDTGDAGAVYCGRDWTSHGTVIRGNLFCSIRGSDARYQNAVYLDDMASGITVEGNLFVRCNWGMLLGGGRDLTIRANAFAACGKAMHFDARGVGWMAPELADPQTSTLRRRLAAMPIDAEPWRSRFPTLVGYLGDRFGRPVGGRVDGTILIGGTPLGAIDDRECVREQGTVALPVPADELDARCAAWLQSVRRERATIGALTIGPVGPRPR